MATLLLAQSCHEGIDTTRDAAPIATLGDDIYGLLCDRLGASSISEDLSGASFHDVCHFDADGHYGDLVDVTVLPPPSSDKAKTARALSVAKLERLAQLRPRLIHAFNAAFPDIDIPDPTTDDPADTIRLHDALLRFSQDITALYEPSSEQIGTQPVMPQTTEAFGRLFAEMESSAPLREALRSIAARRGYRPHTVQLGAIRTLLAYPEMRPFVRAQLEVLGPTGTAVPELQQLLGVTKAELRAATANVAPLAPLAVAEDGQPNRPRTALEVTSELMLDQSDSYADPADPGAPARFIARRDRRGFVMPMSSAVTAPFADLDGNGFADVDDFGRFLDGAGQPLALASPFYLPGEVGGPVDAYGRPEEPLYQYVDTNRTLVGAMARTLVPLVDPNHYASEGDAAPWAEEHEALMYALAGVHVLAGPRAAATYDPVTEQILPADASCPGSPSPITGEVVPCVAYQRFVAEESPLPDLVHALGQAVAHQDSDVVLLGLIELLENHEEQVARLMGAALRIKEIADEHDALAAQGLEPLADLADDVPVWDQMAAVVDDMADQPGLFARLIGALANPVMVQSHQQDTLIPDPPASHFGETLSAFMVNRDQYTYDPAEINGPAYNVTDGYPSLRNPHNRVDRGQALVGPNRSMFERSAQLIYDGNRAKTCNKNNAYVHTSLGIDWPTLGAPGYDECKLFEFSNVGAFYLDANLPSNHPKRAYLEVKAGDLQALLDFIGAFTSVDALLEDSSGLDGLNQHPSPQSLNRLLFFGANSEEFGELPDYDASNAGSDTALFVENAVEPACGLVCPTSPPNDVRDCSEAEDVLRVRDYAVIFGWERLGFYQYLQPQLQAFAAVGCNETVTACDPEDYTGENFFLDLVSTLWKHWPGPDHGDNCDSDTSATDARYCSGAGINRYEPILGDAFVSDMLPALHEFAVATSELSITVQRGPKKGQVVTGPEVVELLVKIMFDQEYAASVGMTDRFGKSSASWVDGTPQDQLTVYSLFADALTRMDARFAASDLPDAGERQQKWKRARSLLVDEFLAVEGSGASARFKNPATPKAMLVGLRLLREQLNANCPDRETTGKCDWAAKDLSRKLSDTLSRPVFASIADLTNAIQGNDGARRELERFLSYALLSQSSQDALQGVLASLGDMLQILLADDVMSPILVGVATAASPAADEEGPGCADRTIQALDAMSSDKYDRYHVLDYVLPALVTPMDDGAGPAPMDVIADAIADIHRIDAAQDGPLDDLDYQNVFKVVREFFTSDTRGFQQLYYIVQNRPK